LVFWLGNGFKYCFIFLDT